MKPKFLEFFWDARQHKNEKFRTQLSIFIVCLVISFFLWALVRLSKEYYYTLNYHLNFAQVPWNYKLVKSSDSILTFRIRLQGFDFFSEEVLLRKRRAYEINLKNIKVKLHEGNYYGILLTEPLGREIISETNFNSDVYSVRPDTIFLQFEKRFPKPKQNPEN
ncbi:MAG: hypothetical protein WCO93_08835 [bacterium]